MAVKGSYKDISGERFGKLLVLSYAEHRKESAYFLCKCECGNEAIICGVRLRNGHTQSCGCKCNANMIGKKFSKLLVLEKNGVDAKGKLLWLCRCDCGNEVIIRGPNLRNGNTKSCGCSRHKSQYKEMIGFWSGHLEVVEFAGLNAYQNAMWKCLCHRCGNTKVIGGGHLRRKDTKSCGCLKATTKFRKYPYKGNTYRSSYEYLIALICEQCGVKFEYEPKCFHFELNNVKTIYTPDFYLADLDLWLEVKGYFWNNSKEKYEWFASNYPSILIEQKDIQSLLTKSFWDFYKKWKDCNFESNFGIRHLVLDNFRSMIGLPLSSSIALVQ